MSFGLLNAVMLFGLAALVVPPIIHLIHRRRYEVVDWGAMQFLEVSDITRRRFRLEELILMALRMLLIAIMVLGLAAPYVTGVLFAGLDQQPGRDAVVILDGSYSMNYAGNGVTAFEKSKAWADQFVDRRRAGDTIAVIRAREQPRTIIASTPAHEKVRDAIAGLKPSHGGSNLPDAIVRGLQDLEKSKRDHQDLIVLTDGQRFGFADDAAMLRWRFLAEQLRETDQPGLRIWVENLAPDRPESPPNWSLSSLRSNRVVTPKGLEVSFRYQLEVRGAGKYQPPERIRLEIDGKPVRDLEAPPSGPKAGGLLPLSFRHRFEVPGWHVASVIVEPDLPASRQPPGYQRRDRLPDANRQDFAIEIVESLPVLLVDAEPGGARHRASDFLRDALSPSGDPTPVVTSRVLPLSALKSGGLNQAMGKGPDSRPRVVVLCNIPPLNTRQEQEVARFLGQGGGILVTLGNRADATYFNDTLFGGGEGWLPMRLESVAGTGMLSDGAQPNPASFRQSALGLFRGASAGGLGEARFGKWWKLTLPDEGAAAPLALLTTGDPFLVERPFETGRVVVAAVPMDNSWKTNLPQLPAFAPLAHELVYYLAGTRSGEHLLRPGEPIRYRPPTGFPLTSVTVDPPESESELKSVNRWPFTWTETIDPGVYQLKAGPQTVFYVVRPDRNESDLTPCTDAERDAVRQLLTLNRNGTPVPFLEYGFDPEKVQPVGETRQQKKELWWWFLLAVIALLCTEVWFTRRISRARGSTS